MPHILQNSQHSQTAQRHITPWTGTEIVFLREHYPTMGSRWCAQALGRTHKAVINQAVRHGIVFEKSDFSTLDAIKTHCRVDPDTGCWIWQGAYSSSKLPEASIAGKKVQMRTHVYRLEHPYLPVKEGYIIRPNCGRRQCVCPDHLVQISWSAFNTKVQETLNKTVHRQRTLQALERRGVVKLNWAAVHEIRASDEPNSVLAKRFGVKTRTVRQVRNGESWRDDGLDITRIFFFR